MSVRTYACIFNIDLANMAKKDLLKESAGNLMVNEFDVICYKPKSVK